MLLLSSVVFSSRVGCRGVVGVAFRGGVGVGRAPNSVAGEGVKVGGVFLEWWVGLGGVALCHLLFLFGFAGVV